MRHGLPHGRGHPKWDDFDEALAAVADVGPGGHYLGHPHTQANFQRRSSCRSCSTTTPIEQWIADGSKEITARALDYARKLLADYEEPKLDEAKDEALRDYIARREREIPAAEALNQDY
jgi:trimethylamine--corrinoid protein Co-methyltransferase